MQAVHHSDCAMHNGPAYEPGPCDCGFSERRIAELEASIRELVAHATSNTFRLAQDHPAVIRARKALGVKAT